MNTLNLMARLPVLFIAFVACATSLAKADEWPQWRGPQRDGIWREAGVVDAFPSPQLELKWRAEIGSGYSSPTVADGRVYVTDRMTDPEQVERVQALARSPLESRLVKVYTGYREGELMGYAFIDVHNVRTLPEAFLVVLGPSGDVQALRVLAFHEPLEYKPADRWYEQFETKSLAAPLRLGGDVHGIVGATLSARATTRGVRRALALYEVVVRGDAPGDL